MDHLLYSFTRAIKSLFAPGMFSVIIFSVIITIIALIGFASITGIFFAWLGAHFDSIWVGVIGTLGTFWVSWLLFPGVMPIIVSFFDNRIATLIERDDYPQMPTPKDHLFWLEFLHDAKFVCTTLTLNILVLPLYLVPMVNIVLFYLLNGYLLGREFFMMVARRHITITNANALRIKHSRIVTAAGMALTLMATIPFINLIAPFWGIAVMTHLYQRVKA